MDVLGWELSAVTPYSVLDHLLRSSVASSEPQMSTVHRHAETFVALAAIEHAFVGLCPAVVAAACLGSALAGLRAEVSLEDVINELSKITRTKEVGTALLSLYAKVFFWCGGCVEFAELLTLTWPRSNRQR